MIITKDDNISDLLALALVAQVVENGKVSTDSKGNQFYCWATEFTSQDDSYVVYTRRNLKQPSFIVKHIPKD